MDITDVTVSLRYKALEKARQWITLDGGAKVNPDQLDLDALDPFVSFRIRGTSDFDPWALRLTQFIVWFKSEGFSATSRFDLERRISNNTILLRMTGKAIWSEEGEGVQLVQGVSFRKRLSHNRAIGLDLSGEGHTQPSTIDTYKTTLTYRQRLYRNWAFIAVEPGAQFLREDHFKFNPSIVFSLEIQFGKL